MKSMSTIFPFDFIEKIHDSIKEFVKVNYSDESIFFEGVWDIYEPQLRKWSKKPPKKWRFKLAKRKHPKILSMSDGTESLDLITPKVIEVVSASFFQVAVSREQVSLERIEEIMQNTCGKKIFSELGLKIIKHFPLLILEDLQKMGLIPVQEKDVKREFKKVPPLEPGRDGIFRKTVEEKKEYKVYSHEFVSGKQLTEEEYKEYSARIELEKGNYCFIIDEGRNRFYYKGNPIEKNLPAKSRIALKYLLVKKRGYVASYKDIYEYTLKTKPGEYFKSDRQTVHRWISDLRDGIGDELNWFLKRISGTGYEVAECKDLKFCIFERLPR